MNAYFNKVEDFSLPVRKGSHRENHLNDFMTRSAMNRLGFLHTDADLITVVDGYVANKDPALSEFQPLRDTLILLSSLDHKAKGNRHPSGNAHIAQLETEINIFFTIFNNENYSPLEQLITIEAIPKIKRNYSHTFDNLSPISPRLNTVAINKSVDLEVADFEGVKMLEIKNGPWSALSHSISPFLMLRDEIDKLEENLFHKFSIAINRMLKTTSFAEFFKDALIIIGHVKTHLAKPTETAPVIDPDSDQSLNGILGDDGFGYPVRHGKDYTMLGKFNLDCHCGGSDQNWKVDALSIIIEAIFQMQPK